MSKNMFYNYDNYAESKDICCLNAKKCIKRTSAEYLYNIKGDFIGITAENNSDFIIYFNFYSENNSELSDLLYNNQLSLEILDSNGDLVLTVPATMSETHFECWALIDLAKYKHIRNGKYRIYLYSIGDNNKTLLYDKANLLTIK